MNKMTTKININCLRKRKLTGICKDCLRKRRGIDLFGQCYKCRGRGL